MSPNQAPRSSRGRATYRALLLSAARLFAEKGFAETSTREIAAEAGINAATMYRYWSSKEDLAARVVDAGYYLYAAEIPEDFQGPWVQLVLDSATVLAYRTPRDAFIRAATRLNIEQDGPYYGRLWTQYIPMIAGILKEAAARGELLPGVIPEDAASYWVSSYLGVDIRFRRCPFDLCDAIALANRHVLRGLVTQDTLMQVDVTADRGRVLYEEAFPVGAEEMAVALALSSMGSDS